jgi:Uroporphyrinogen decarboxylase (URO-D)
MNAKERITVAMKNGIPDRVPVTLGLSESVPVRFFTDDYIEFFWKSKIPIWKARIETEHDRFGADGYLHLCEEASPKDPVVEKKNIKEKKDEIFYTKVIHTPKGNLEADFYLSRKSTTSAITHFVKNLEEDIPKVLELLKHPDSKKLDNIELDYNEIGNRGHVGYWLSTPVDWWSGLRGTQQMLFDLMDHEELFLKTFEVYTEYAEYLVENVLKNTPLDSICLGGSTTSMSVISPDLHRKFSLPFGKIICKKAHEFDIPVHYHMCGKSRAALPITSEMGVDGFDALESPPTGTVDLAEVKKTFGHKHSLRGNVNSITVMKEGKPEDVEKDILRCMNNAKEGGGFILGVGDQTPYETSEENMFAFVETGKRLGKY